MKGGVRVNSKTAQVNQVTLKYHNKELTRSRYQFIENLTPKKVKALAKELSYYDTGDVLVRFKGKDHVIEFNGCGLDSIDLNIMRLDEWRRQYGRDNDEKPERI